jgi:hypothetical protein
MFKLVFIAILTIFSSLNCQDEFLNEKFLVDNQYENALLRTSDDLILFGKGLLQGSGLILGLPNQDSCVNTALSPNLKKAFNDIFNILKDVNMWTNFFKTLDRIKSILIGQAPNILNAIANCSLYGIELVDRIQKLFYYITNTSVLENISNHAVQNLSTLIPKVFSCVQVTESLDIYNTGFCTGELINYIVFFSFQP